MATQIQTTAGIVAKAYEAKIVVLQRYHEEGIARYEQAKAEWDARSWWYRFWHSWDKPYMFQFVSHGAVHDATAKFEFYRDLPPEPLVAMDEDTAMWLRLDYVKGDGVDGR